PETRSIRAASAVRPASHHRYHPCWQSGADFHYEAIADGGSDLDLEIGQSCMFKLLGKRGPWLAVRPVPVATAVRARGMMPVPLPGRRTITPPRGPSG